MQHISNFDTNKQVPFFLQRWHVLHPRDPTTNPDHRYRSVVALVATAMCKNGWEFQAGTDGLEVPTGFFQIAVATSALIPSLIPGSFGGVVSQTSEKKTEGLSESTFFIIENNWTSYDYAAKCEWHPSQHTPPWMSFKPCGTLSWFWHCFCYSAAHFIDHTSPNQVGFPTFPTAFQGKLGVEIVLGAGGMITPRDVSHGLTPGTCKLPSTTKDSPEFVQGRAGNNSTFFVSEIMLTLSCSKK